MSVSEIKILLEAFYNGSTTREEERILFEYFNGENVVDELVSEKEVFLAICEKESIEVPIQLEYRLNNLIDDFKDNDLKQKEIKRFSIWKYISVAACIALIASVGFYLHNRPKVDSSMTIVENTSDTDKLTPEDIEKLKKAESALLLVSKNFNKGMDQLAMVSLNVDKTNRIINKATKRNKTRKS